MIARLNKYTPSFIKENDLLTAIYTAIGNSLTLAQTAISDLKDSNWTGKGLRLKAIEWGIFHKISDSDTVVQNLMDNRFVVAKGRGTLTGIGNDLTNMLGAGTITTKGINESGVILNVTRPGIDKETFLDARKVAFINHVGAKAKSMLIEREIFPLDIKIIYE